MLGLNNKNQVDETIKNPPCDDSYPMTSILFSKNKGVGVNALSLTILDLINKDQIKCAIDLDDSYEVGKKLTPQDMEVMKKITFRIANKGELKTSETLAINLLKNMNKNKKFNLKAMAKQTITLLLLINLKKTLMNLLMLLKMKMDSMVKTIKTF